MINPVGGYDSTTTRWISRVSGSTSRNVTTFREGSGFFYAVYIVTQCLGVARLANTFEKFGI